MTELITTAEEFAALPIGTVVRSPGGYVFEQWLSGWERVGIALDWWHDEMAQTYSPATVLYRPDAEPIRPEREVKAEALREAAADYGSAQISGVFLGRDDYPRAWLRARADRIERSEP